MRVRTLFVIFFLLALLALVQASGRARDRLMQERVLLSVNGYELIAERADSDSERMHGLSGREKLGTHEGILFIFPRADYHGIWMKDMLFPIDIIWLQETQMNADTDSRINADGISVNRRGNQRVSAFRVVDSKENVLPSTFPEVFYPKEKAKYVLETKSGLVKDRNVAIGDVLTMK